MAVFHAMTGGTKSSGASTAGSWVASNCYPTIALAWAALAADGDEVILNDEDWVLSAAVAGSAITVAGTVTVKSRSGDRTLCSIDSSSATASMFNLNKTVTVTSYVFEDIRFKKSVTHTNNSASMFVQGSQATGDITLRRCRLGDCTVAHTANNQTGLVRNITAAAARKLPLDACEFGGIVYSNTGSGCYLGATGSGHTLEIVNGLTVDGVTSSGGVGFGGFYAGGPVVVDEVVARNITLAGATINAVIYQNTNSASLAVESISGEDITVTGATCSAALLYLTKPYVVGAVAGSNVNVAASTETSGLGGLVVAVGDAAQGAIESIDAYRCGSRYGTAIYLSNGAGAVIRRVIARGCGGDMGIVYKGGHGDMTLDAYVCLDGAQWGPVPTEAANGGLALYVHNNNGRDCVATVNSMTAAGNFTDGGKPAVNLVNGSATHAVTINLRNALLQNGLVHEIRVGSANVVNFNMTTACMDGGDDAILDETSGTYNDVITGTVDAAMEIDRVTYLPPRASAARAAGTWVPGARAIDDLPRSVHPDIGAAEDREWPGRRTGVAA